MGSSLFALPALNSLIKAGFNVLCVYAQPPRPAGRGQKERRCPVHAFAADEGMDVRTPKSFLDTEAQTNFLTLNADAVVVASYGLILPKSLLYAPKFGCINIHASLLPRWRGASPIQRAIEAGDELTGISVIAMDEGLDTGGVYLKGETPITSETTTDNLQNTLASMGGELVVEVLKELITGALRAIPQPLEGVTYAKKISGEERQIDWQYPAKVLSRKLRALSPTPGVWGEHAGERIKFIAGAVEAYDGNASPGTVVREPLVVACGEDALRIEIAQRPGKSAMATSDLVRGFPIPVETILN